MAASGDGAAGVRAERTPGLTALAAALAGGVWLSSAAPEVPTWCWVAVATAGLVAAAIAMAMRRRVTARWCLVLVCAGVGAARLALADRPTGVVVGEEPRLVRLRGTVVDRPVSRPGAVGPLARFSHRRPTMLFGLRVDALGTVVVRVDEPAPALRAGDVVTVRGFLLAPRGPRNPGGFDGVHAARARGRVGMVSVPSGGLVRRERSCAASRWTRWRAVVRDHAERGLLLGVAADDPCAGLLSALFLGRRTGGQDPVRDAFRRVGVGHLLAISGLHLGILAGLVLLAARAGGVPRRRHAWLVVAAVLAYLLLVETRMPVLRAGLMILAASLGLLAGRRLEARGLMALSAAVLLYRWPHQLFEVGFQLSYTVVFALIELASTVRRRCFGLPDREAASAAAMLLEWLKTAWTVAVVAWLVACPLTLHHFGFVSPLGVCLSLALVPYVAVVLAMGYLKMAISLAAPAAAPVLAAPLLAVTQLLIAIVNLADRVPGAVLRLPFPGPIWTVTATAWVWLWLGGRPRIDGRWHAAAAVLLLVWLVEPAAPGRDAPALRIDMLAVGNGSCYVVRSAGRVVVFDAGSSSRADAGGHAIVSSLRRWNVHRIDVVVVSHANFDHYAAVPALVEAMPVGEVLVTPQFVRAGADEAVAHLLELLRRRGVPVRQIAAGDERRIGHTRWTWLHPPPKRRFERTNDASMVVRVEAAGRAVLLTGDVETEALAMLLERSDDLRADVLELPHHGSDTASARALVQRSRPSIVLQSTGWTRWRQDTWGEALVGARRLVTARDGACTVQISSSGEIVVRTFVHGAED